MRVLAVQLRLRATTHRCVALALGALGASLAFSVEEVRYGPERLQTGDFVTPAAEARGMVMLIHGGFWKAGAVNLDCMKRVNVMWLTMWSLGFAGAARA